ncbi:unnamed protein product [Caenorhabditis auriculariae]|uniref:Uncharacterized protein n=1 Tax=Caenorhabditis auriculariae TaxID=2777116 RepID=A0A8S1H643_9PELO|nr:unnamed protein product [Caenorhabditis auriculariae]
MSQQLSTLLRFLFLQCVMIAVCSAYPYILVPQMNSRNLAKRSFDRLDNSAFSFGTKRAFDRLDDSPFGLVKRSLVKRAFDRLENADFGLRRKRSFDRITRADFDLRVKRAFDRLGGTEFGLMKRSVPEEDPIRDELVDELTHSISALRQARAADQQTRTEKDVVPLVVSYEGDE